MNPLEKILAKGWNERTKADLEYLELHKSELSFEQLEQLSNEEDQVITFDNADKKEFNLNVETKDLGDGEIEVIVNSGKEDRHGEVINIDGLDIKKFMKNPVVMWAHDYSLPPIGKALKMWKDGKKLMAKMKFAIDENPQAKVIYDLVKGGFLNAVSIGFIPFEMVDNMFTKSEMVEFSVVPIPADSNALITARKMGIDTDLLNIYDKSINMKYELSKVLAKEIEDLTLGEIKFLKENLDNLTKAQITKYASVLKDADEGDNGDEDEGEEGDTGTETPAGDEETQEEVKKLRAEVEALKKADKVVIKNIYGGKAKKGDDEEDNKHLKFFHYVKGLQSGNFAKYKEIMQKDGMNTSDDAVLLPPQEFVTEITRLEEDFGVAARYATVRRSGSGAGIKYLLGDDDVEIFDTAESGVKKSTKLSFNSQQLLWRKFAAILPITDELTEDSAIDLWAEATRRFARAYSKREDQLVFTEAASGGNTKDGIVNVSGTNEVFVTNPDAITYDDLVDMELGIPSASAAGARWYLNRKMLAPIKKMKDENNNPLWARAMADGTPATIMGYPYVETEVLPRPVDAEDGDGLMVFGDLRYSTLGMRTQLNIKIFDSGSVGDPDDEDQSDQINLLTQDAQAMRCVKRMNAICRFPAAFSVLKVGTGS